MLMKNLFASKLTKIILSVILVIGIAISSAAATYLFIHQKRQDTPKQPTAFSKTVEDLKQQAHKAILESDYSEDDTEIVNMGEKLKEILTSDDAALLTNSTFNDDEFSVIISDFPLQDGKSIRRIEYTIENNREDENDISDKQSRFFLQYIGSKTFFSGIEDLDYDEKDFKVYENADGCFAFSLFSQSDYINDEYTNYYTNIYIPEDNKFTVKEHVDIPIKSNSNDNLELTEKNEIIKAIVYNGEHQGERPKCLFDSTKLSFEIPKGNAKSSSVKYNIPGLLLGLSDSQGNLRTLFIRQVDKKIRCNEYAEQLIFPHNDKLYALKNYSLDYDMYEDEFGNENDYSTGSLNFQKILSAPLGVNLTDDFDNIFSSRPKYGYYTVTDIPLYVGSDYVCYVQNLSYSGGGSYHWGSSNIRFDKLDNLSKFTATCEDSDTGLTLTPNFKETTLADLIYGAQAKGFYQSDVRTYGEALSPYTDFKQLCIKRNLGKWSLMLPVMEEAYHPGNGSNGNSVADFATFSNDVPDSLASNCESMSLDGSWDNWTAKDLIKFPKSNAVLTQFDYYISIGLQKADYDLYIPINLDEYIVSINFADADTIKSWTNELKNIK